MKRGIISSLCEWNKRMASADCNQILLPVYADVMRILKLRYCILFDCYVCIYLMLYRHSKSRFSHVFNARRNKFKRIIVILPRYSLIRFRLS